LRFRDRAPAAVLRRLKALSGRLETCVVDRIAAKDVAAFCKQVLAAAFQVPLCMQHCGRSAGTLLAVSKARRQAWAHAAPACAI